MNEACSRAPRVFPFWVKLRVNFLSRLFLCPFMSFMNFMVNLTISWV